MNASQLQVWFDAAMAALKTKFAGHPVVVGILNYVQKLGDQFIPSIPGAIPNLPTPVAAFDWLMNQLIAAFPAEAFFLNIVKALVDSWLSQAGQLPALPKA